MDVSAVRRFGSRLMQAAMPALVALGPVNKLETYSAFANRFGAVGSRAAE